MERHVIIRSETAGVFMGILLDHDPATMTVKIGYSRRLWRWAGAMTLSELAVNGTTKPEECKFAVEVPQMTVAKVIEIIPASQEAVASIKGVPVWRE